MATYLLDFDGVFFRYGTMEPVDGAVEFVQGLRQQGHRVVFLTQRRRCYNEPPHLTLEKTEQVLAALGVTYDGILEGVTSPRVLVNDGGSLAIDHPRDSPLNRITLESSRAPQRSDMVSRVYHALAAVAWVAWKYADSGDADDYVQTLLIAKSLTTCGGFDHADLITRYRARPGYRVGGDELQAGGVHPNYKGQVAKLIQSDDPLYEATDGVSDGAAMKIVAAAAFYADDFQGLVENTDRISRITHATVEARLAAVLIALRFRQVLLGIDPDNMNRLVEELAVASDILQFGGRAAFFLDRVGRARQVATKYERPANLLYQLCRKVGMDHLAWSTPVAACFWSFHRDVDFSKWFRHHHEKRMYLSRRYLPIPRVVHGRTLKSRVHDEDVRHLRAIGQYDDFRQSHGYHWRKSVDIDTFFSIAISIMAARQGLESVETEVTRAIDMFGDDLWSLSERLVQVPEKNDSREAA